jgi:hypothetical protein
MNAHLFVLICLYAFFAMIEEGMRLVGVWRGSRVFSYRLGHSPMFGSGFGGIEVVLRRAGNAFIRIIEEWRRARSDSDDRGNLLTA